MTVFRNDTREIELLGVGDPRNPAVLAVLRPCAYVDGTVQTAGPLPVYSVDSRRLAVLDGDRTVRVWDIGNSRKPAIVATFGAARQVVALSMSADGDQLFIATEENVVQPAVPAAARMTATWPRPNLVDTT